MTYEQFWYGDIDLMVAYRDAYYNKVTYEAWVYGARVFEATTKAVSNAMRTKPSEKVLEYSPYESPIEKLHEKVTPISPEDKEKIFREQQADTVNWLFR